MTNTNLDLVFDLLLIVLKVHEVLKQMIIVDCIFIFDIISNYKYSEESNAQVFE